jgi:hypothetical protein
MNFLAPQQGWNLMEHAELTPVLTVCGHYFPALVWRQEIALCLWGTLVMLGTSF